MFPRRCDARVTLSGINRSLNDTAILMQIAAAPYAVAQLAIARGIVRNGLPPKLSFLPLTSRFLKEVFGVFSDEKIALSSV